MTRTFLISLAGFLLFFGSLGLGSGQSAPATAADSLRLPEVETDVLGASVVEVDPSDPLLTIVSSARSSVTAVPASLEADGQTSTTIVVTLRTEDGTLVSGAQVTLVSSRGVQDQIETVHGISGPDGQAIFLVRSPEAGSAILTASAGTKLIDQKATIKFVDPTSATAGLNAKLAWAGLGAIVLLIFFQYFFARIVLSARTREEEELFFHHPEVLSKR